MPIEIIAEAAQGFEGHPRQALLLARAAVRAKADYIKFQLVYADELATPAYQYYELYQSLEMTDQEWLDVAKEAHDGGCKLCFDVFGTISLAKAKEFGADAVKVHSTDFFNEPLIEGALQKFDRLFMSHGGIEISELEEKINSFSPEQKAKIIFLYGFQAEPTPMSANNLRRLGALSKKFTDVKFGFMDHADGDAPEAQTLALLALPFGAHAIEKHIGLDRCLEIEDYVSALSGDQFKVFVESIRNHEQALGSDSFDLTPEEAAYRGRALKCALAGSDLAPGTVLSADNVVFKRPGSPSSAPIYRASAVYGKTLKQPVTENTPITPEDLA